MKSPSATLHTLHNVALSECNVAKDSRDESCTAFSGQVALLHSRENTLQRKSCVDASPGAVEALPLDAILTPRADADLGTWRKFLGEFEEEMKLAGYSLRTVYLYTREARRFVYWLRRRGVSGPMNVTPEHCIGYQRAVYYHLTSRGDMNPVNSQRIMLTSVRSFTGFLRRRGYALVDPGLAIVMPKTSKRLPRDILTEDEITRILSTPDVGTLRGYRDRTILEVLYGTGIRSGELVNLDTTDVDLDSGTLRIREGKGRKDRFVPLGAVAVEFVAGYIKRVRSRLFRNPRGTALFPGWDGRKLKKAGQLHVDLRRILEKAGIKKDVVLHTFRHTCATHMLKGGANIRQIQVLLGHTSLATTEQYTKVEIGDLKKAHDAFHPRKKL